MKPIYQRLSEDSLLQKCLDGKTQNQNEALNAMMWERVPKGVFVGSEVLQLGVYDAVSHFNITGSNQIKVFETLGIPPGEFCLIECQQSDYNRVSKAEYKSQERNKTIISISSNARCFVEMFVFKLSIVSLGYIHVPECFFDP